MGNDLKDAVVLITGAKQKAFGTGFIIQQQADTSYILTCQHVYDDVQGSQAIYADGQKAVCVSQIHHQLDLIVLAVKNLEPRTIPHLARPQQTDIPIQICGYSSFQKPSRIKRTLDAVLGKATEITQTGAYKINAWDVQIKDEQSILPGYSGSPLLDTETGAIFAIIVARQGESIAYAIDLRHLSDIWPQAEQLFTQSPHKPDTPAQQQQLIEQIRIKLLQPNAQPLLILAPRYTDTALLIHWLRQQADEIYGCASHHLLTPIQCEDNEAAEFFQQLAEDCQLDDPAINNASRWCRAIKKRLQANQSEQLLLIINRFENANPKFSRQLASEIRTLDENHANFRALIIGGERLASLRWESGDHSLLNYAEPFHYPELDQTNIRAIYAQRYPDLNQLLQISGGHPRLVETCLQNKTTNPAQCEPLLNTSPAVSELFIPFRDDAKQLRKLLQQETLERYNPWPVNPLIRKLYWHNLITQRGDRFVWRSGFIRELGMREIE